MVTTPSSNKYSRVCEAFNYYSTRSLDCVFIQNHTSTIKLSKPSMQGYLINTQNTGYFFHFFKHVSFKVTNMVLYIYQCFIKNHAKILFSQHNTHLSDCCQNITSKQNMLLFSSKKQSRTVVFNWNPFEMRLLNLRINFLFIADFLSSSW